MQARREVKTFEGAKGAEGVVGGISKYYYYSFSSIRATHLGCQWTCYDTLSSASPVHSMYVQELFF